MHTLGGAGVGWFGSQSIDGSDEIGRGVDEVAEKLFRLLRRDHSMCIGHFFSEVKENGNSLLDRKQPSASA